MKKVLLSILLGGTIALPTMAQDLVLDLTQPTSPAQIVYTTADIWEQTYNDEAQYARLDFQNFGFSHLPSGNSWGGMSWEGFTVSKVASDTVNLNACMGKGGLAGVGSPFLLGYYSEYFGEKCNLVTFLDGAAYAPKKVSLCMGAAPYNDIVNGDYTGYRFTTGDFLTLTIYPLLQDQSVDKTKSVVYYLADYRSQDEAQHTLNRGWEEVDLSTLGDCYGLAFVMQSSAVGDYGTNTSCYFALDGLTVCPAQESAVETVLTNESQVWTVYSATGQYLKTTTATFGELKSSLPRGLYIVNNGKTAFPLVR